MKFETITLIALLSLCGCREESHSSDLQQQPSLKPTLQLKTFFKQNSWSYPVEIELKSLYLNGVRSFVKPDLIDTGLVNNFLSNWVRTTFYDDEACVIFSFSLNGKAGETSLLSCIIRYYRRGDISDEEVVLPLEGHGEIAKAFYIHTEKAYFNYNSKTITFSHWLEK